MLLIFLGISFFIFILSGFEVMSIKNSMDLSSCFEETLFKKTKLVAAFPRTYRHTRINKSVEEVGADQIMSRRKRQPQSKSGNKPNLNKSRSNRHLVEFLQDCGSLLQQDCCNSNLLLKRNKFLNVAIHSPKYGNLDHWVFTRLKAQSDVNVGWLVTNENTSFDFWKIVKPVNIDHMSDIEALIVPDPANTKMVEMLKQRFSAKVICVDVNIRLFLDYNSKYRLIERLHGLQQCGIQILVVSMPVAWKTRNPSKWEEMILGRKISVMNNLEKYVPLAGMEIKYVEIFSKGMLIGNGHIQYKDYVVRADIRSKFLNIINHIRPAVGIPNNTLHDIHLIGDSTVVGYYVTDEDTLASCLQQHINEMNVGEGLYSCLTYGVANAVVDNMQRQLRDVFANPKDIVVICSVGNRNFDTSYFRESCRENGILLCDMQPVLDRPHDMGEVFKDVVHLNPNGNRMIAKALFGKLFVHPSKPYIPNTFVHHFCNVPNFVPDDARFKSARDNLKNNRGVVSFARSLEKYRNASQFAGAVVMNCNPFTLGHLCLVETASTKVDKLFVFVVEEDRSEFLFADRFQLVRIGTGFLPNIVVLKSGIFIISGLTLPEYFDKSLNPDAVVDASADLEIFHRHIAPALGVNIRIVGEEPFDRVTLQYNKAMCSILPKFGVEVQVIPRKDFEGIVISASRVRALLMNKVFREVMSLVPETTFSYLQKRKEKITKLKKTEKLKRKKSFQASDKGGQE